MIVKILASKHEWVCECKSYVIEWAAGMVDVPVPESSIGKIIILDSEGKATDNFRWLRQYDHLYIMNDLGTTIDKYKF